jgi:hypothetical protein
MGESGPQQVCESHFHLRLTHEIGAGARQPWLGRRFAKARNQGGLGDEDREVEEENWRWCEKWLRLIAGSLFNSGDNNGHATVH